MTPTTVLVILLTIVALRPFFEVPDIAARVEAQRRGGYKPNAARGCAYMLLIPVVLGLWWWYAISTGQLLLGVIPTVGAAATVLVNALEQQARKAGTRGEQA